ncbi:MAG TPA: flagellar protein FlaG [Clostridiales bacterium]|nr:flagellar protein FlaG [Clostridiales bacterium]
MKIESSNSVKYKPPKQSVRVDPILKKERIINSKESISKSKTELGYKPSMQEELIIKSVEEINKKLMGKPTGIEISIHKKTNQIMVKVINTDTGETIREIPAEKALDVVAHMCEVAGIFMDEKR